MMKVLMLMFMLIFILMNLNLYLYLYMGMMIFLIFFFILFMLNFNNYWMMIYSNMGMDNLSLMMILLSLWIMGISMIVKMNNFYDKIYIFMLLILLMNLVFSFIWMNLFMFYFFFEFSLIPIFFIIMGWGYQPERLKASLYMLFYTLFFSLPFLLILFNIMSVFNSMNFFIFKDLLINMKDFNSVMFLILMLSAFLVKLPMFIFHNWLPKAHVEAPVVGSMILAAVMLKLGGYGIYRMMMFYFLDLISMNNLFMIISIFGMIYLSFLCLRQFDMKVIVAYSSVVHMGMMLVGLFSMKNLGFLGGMFMMIGHGLCSSGMFVLVNYLYIRTHSRSIFINKGMIYFLPSLMLFWFLLCMNNMAAPISLNLLSEILIILVVLNWSMKIMLFMILGMFFSACYNLYLFSFSFHGMYNMKLIKIYSSKSVEFMVLIFHFIPLNLMILKLNLLI